MKTLVCSRCHRRVLPEDRQGSLTSFLLSDLSCNCNRIGDDGLRQNTPAPVVIEDNSSICRRCNKVIPARQREGSITAFFFQEQRCHCKQPQPDTPAAKAGLSQSPQSGSASDHFRNDTGAKKQSNTHQKGLATRYQGGKRTARMADFRTVLHTMRQTTMSSKTTAASMAGLAPGQIIGGCYELLALAGQGGMGAVFKARHQGLGRACAVKFLAPNLISEKTWLLFQREARMVAELQHRTICQVYDLGIHDEKIPYYAMDFIEGETLDETLSSQGPLSVGATLELYIKVLEGLSYAHRRGIVHKDLKPANLMLTTGGEHQVEVKILDFGISELTEAAPIQGSTLEHSAHVVESTQARLDSNDAKPERAKTQRNQLEIIGSALYMSPEQLLGDNLDRRSDIYTIGCTMFETLTGAPPFLEESFEKLREAHLHQEPPTLGQATGLFFPPKITAIVAKCLEKEPEKRYQSANELSIDLERALQGKELQFARLNAGQALETTEAAGTRPARIMLAAFTVVISTCLASAALCWMAISLMPSASTETVGKQSEKLTGQGAHSQGTSAANQPIAPTVEVIPNQKGGYSVQLTPEVNASDLLLLDLGTLTTKAIPSDTKVLDTTANEKLVLHPLVSHINAFYKSGDLEAEIRGLDLTRDRNAAGTLMLYAGEVFPKLQYMRVCGGSQQEATARFREVARLKDLEALTYVGETKTTAKLSAPAGLKKLTLENYRLPLVSLDTSQTRHLSKTTTLKELMKDENYLHQKQSTPKAIIFKNSQLKGSSFRFLIDHKPPDQVVLEDCRLDESPFEDMAVYGINKVTVLMHTETLPPWLSPESLKKNPIAMPTLVLINPTWTAARCREYEAQVKSRCPGFKCSASNKPE
ncbi:MAG: serine/threonine protein kinase [Candidatus Obscuribacter sp.]|nr:serine/threonine protein kinase [Candidatus Obscuribacter sp.]MBK9277509.1 serine/threonine protein kinase [Candidatus Obscuribacter sp.]